MKPMFHNKKFLLAIVLMFNISFGVTLTTSLFSLYLDKVGISLAGIGLIFAIGALIASIVRLIVGACTDHMGRKKFIIVGAIGYVVFIISIIFSQTTSQFATVNLLAELSGALFWTATNAYFFDILRRGKEGIEMGTRNTALYASSALAPLIGGLVVKNFGFNFLFIASGLIVFAGLLLALTLKETITKTSRVGLREFEKEYRDIFKIKGFKTVTSIIFISNFIWTFWYIYMPIYLSNLGMSIDKIGLILTVMLGAGAVLQKPMGRLIDSKPAKYILIPGFFLIWLGGFFFFAFKNFASYMIGRAILGVGVDASYWPAIGVCAKLTKKRSHGGSWALMTTGAAIAYGIAALAGGFLTQAFGIAHVLMGASAVALIVAILIIPNKFLAKKGTSKYGKHQFVHLQNHRQ